MIQINEQRRYASVLSDGQWAIMEPMFLRAGNGSKRGKNELVDAVLYYAQPQLLILQAQRHQPVRSICAKYVNQSENGKNRGQRFSFPYLAKELQPQSVL